MGCFSMINPDDYLYLVVFTKRRMHFFTGGYLFTCKYWQHAKTGTYTWVPISGLVAFLCLQQLIVCTLDVHFLRLK